MSLAINKVGQKFPADGEQIATGIRDTSSLDWSPADKSLYGIMHGRDETHRTWPAIISAEDDDHIADVMDRIAKGADFGWPYTYYDGVRRYAWSLRNMAVTQDFGAGRHLFHPVLTDSQKGRIWRIAYGAD